MVRFAAGATAGHPNGDALLVQQLCRSSRETVPSCQVMLVAFCSAILLYPLLLFTLVPSLHSSSNNGVLRYRSPKLHMMVTIILPLFSGRAATFAAAAMFPPLLMPPKMPSSFASRRAQSNASSSVI